MKIFHKIAGFFVLLICFGSVFAQTDGEKGIELYQQGLFQDAVKFLKKTTKANPDDADNWYILGSSYLEINKVKEAKKAFEKVIKLKPADPQGYIGLSTAQLADHNIYEAQTSAQKAIELDAQSVEAQYILGAINFRNGFYSGAYNRAESIIKINPNYANAYLLKSEALVSSFGQMSGIVIKSPTERVDLIKEAVVNMEKFISLSTSKKNMPDQWERLESLKFFANYYEKPENQPRNTLEPNPPTNANSTSIKFISKPRAEYTDSARNAQISGRVRLLVGFPADGKIKHILVLSGLGRDLNNEAIKAANNIKYEPATKDGQPISVVKIIEYTFTIY